MTDELFDVEQESQSQSSSKRTQTAPSESIVLRLYVRPGAGRAAVAGRRGDALHIHVAPPPADGRANEACIELVAELFDVARSDVELVGGEHSRMKRVRVRGVDAERARKVLDTAIGDAEGSSRRPRGLSPKR